MMRGSANEYCVQNCLRELTFVKRIYDIGLMCDKERGSLGCSADVISSLDLTALKRKKKSQMMMARPLPLPY